MHYKNVLGKYHTDESVIRSGYQYNSGCFDRQSTGAKLDRNAREILQDWINNNASSNAVPRDRVDWCNNTLILV